MKTKLLLLFTFISFYANAQLVLLDEPLGNGEANIISVAVYDNDLMYSMERDNTSRVPEIYVSNGTPGDRIELLAGSNSKAVFHQTISQDGRRVYGNGNFKVGNKIFAAIQVFGSSDVNIYQFNASRTFLTPNNIFKKTTDATTNISLIGKEELLTIDSIKVDNKNRLRIHHFTKNNGIRNYTLPEIFFGSTRPSGFFNWGGSLYFVARIFGEEDIYKIDALETVRVTENKVSLGSASKGVAPSKFLLDDFIYFTGREGFYTNVNPGPIKRNTVTAICYANGNNSFGSTDTEIHNGDDGSLGYKAYSDTNFVTNILGKLGSNIVYYRASERSFFSTPNNSRLNIPTTNSSDPEFIQFNDKIYTIPRITNMARNLYIIGQNNDISTVEIPPFPNTNNFAQKVGEMLVKDDKIFFIGSYFFDNKGRYVLFSYKEGDATITTELEFPEDIVPNINLYYPYNNGFVFRSKPSNSSKESLYTWNVESRSKILDNGNAKTSKLGSNATFKYDETTYSITSNTTTFNENDQLKVQILDTLSTQFKEVVKNFPASTEKNRISNLFYSLNTLKTGNTHQSNLTLTYNDAMFTNTTTTSENLSVMAFYDGNWTEITPTSFNNSTKEITINANFLEEAFLFFKINGTLSLNNIAVNNNLSIYPNPAKSNITISLSDKNEIKKVEIYSVLGDKVMIEKVFKKSSIKINTSKLSTGIYIIKAFINDKTISKKLIIN